MTGSGSSAPHVPPLTRTAASAAVGDHGWRLVLGALRATVSVASLAGAAAAGLRAVGAAGADGDDHLRLDLRPDRVELAVHTLATGAVTATDVDLARRITRALADEGLTVTPGLEGQGGVQALEIAIDAMNIAAVRPFWKAVLAFADDPADPGPTGALVDPAGQQPAVWFQQMDRPRPERNRIHLDVTVAHDEVDRRVAAALAAGGTLRDDAYARMFWVLADAEGNECCVCTWTDRDEWEEQAANR